MSKGKPGKGILVTSVSAKRMLMRALRGAATRETGPGARIWAGDCRADAPAKTEGDAFWKMPRHEELNPAVLKAFCRVNSIGTIIPTRDGELLEFARWAPELGEAGIHVLTSRPAAVYRCLDKLLLYRCIEQFDTSLAIPTAKQLDVLNGRRFVVKERLGSGGQGLAVDVDARTAFETGLKLAEPVYQPFVEGCEFSADVYIAQCGKAVGVVPRWREHIVGGESAVTTTFQDAELEERIGGLCEQLGLTGPAVVQGLVEPSGAVRIIEVNARFGGASTLGIAAGLDIFGWWLRERRGEAIHAGHFRRIDACLRLVREDGLDCIRAVPSLQAG